MEMPFKRVSVIGLGYVGLPTAALIAGRGVEVVGVDVNPGVVESVNRGEVQIAEPDLDIVVRAAVQMGNLRASLKAESADAFLIAVPTPISTDAKPDCSYVDAATDAIAPVLQPGNLVILESTVPIGTTEAMARRLQELRPELTFPQTKGENADVQIAFCPERILPGQILKEIVTNDRIVGGLSPRCTERAAALYGMFVSGQLLRTNARTAEMSKLTENAYRDVNVAFANEMAAVAESLGIDPWELIGLANHHPRVDILRPGPGVGGHCIAVDPWFIVAAAPSLARLTRIAREVNDARPHAIADEAMRLAERFKKPTIACLGLAYKQDVNDFRNSPAMTVVELLLKKKAGRILVVEPYTETLPRDDHADISGAELVDLASAIQAADVVVGLVRHRPFRNFPVDRLKNKMLVDPCGIWH